MHNNCQINKFIHYKESTQARSYNGSLTYDLYSSLEAQPNEPEAAGSLVGADGQHRLQCKTWNLTEQAQTKSTAN